MPDQTPTPDPSSRQPLEGSPAHCYQRYFVPQIGAPVAEDLLDAAALRRGERVLDVGCGTGVVARLAAQHVGHGMVAGLDPNPAMLEVAGEVTPEEMEIAWYQAPAESMPLADDSFDVVLCQMALQFVPDRPTALAEMHRVLAPEGRLALNLPGPAAPPLQHLAEALGRHIHQQAAGFVGAVFGLHDEAAIEALLEGAGFVNTRVSANVKELRVPAPREFMWQYIASTPLADVVGAAGEEARAALEGDVVAGWTHLVDGDGMTVQQRMVTATAHV